MKGLSRYAHSFPPRKKLFAIIRSLLALVQIRKRKFFYFLVVFCTLVSNFSSCISLQVHNFISAVSSFHPNDPHYFIRFYNLYCFTRWNHFYLISNLIITVKDLLVKYFKFLFARMRIFASIFQRLSLSKFVSVKFQCVCTFERKNFQAYTFIWISFTMRSSKMQWQNFDHILNIFWIPLFRIYIAEWYFYTIYCK